MPLMFLVLVVVIVEMVAYGSTMLVSVIVLCLMSVMMLSLADGRERRAPRPPRRRGTNQMELVREAKPPLVNYRKINQMELELLGPASGWPTAPLSDFRDKGVDPFQVMASFQAQQGALTDQTIKAINKALTPESADDYDAEGEYRRILSVAGIPTHIMGRDPTFPGVRSTWPIVECEKCGAAGLGVDLRYEPCPNCRMSQDHPPTRARDYPWGYQ